MCTEKLLYSRTKQYMSSKLGTMILSMILEHTRRCDGNDAGDGINPIMTGAGSAVTGGFAAATSMYDHDMSIVVSQENLTLPSLSHWWTCLPTCRPVARSNSASSHYAQGVDVLFITGIVMTPRSQWKLILPPSRAVSADLQCAVQP